VIPIGYETDSYQMLPAGTVCASGALTTPPAGSQYGGTDFNKGIIRIAVSAIASATAFAICLQDSGDGGTTWNPTVLAAADMANAPGYATVTPVAAKNFEVTLTNFPGNLFRVVAWATGGTVTCGITGDFQKFVADQT
jgi:hypothetical protein